MLISSVLVFFIFNRPFHKQFCDPGLDGGIQPLIKSVIGNPMIAHYLKVCIVYELHLLDTNRTPEEGRALCRSPLIVHIDIGIEPTKITDFMNLYTFKNDWPGEKNEIEGMLQFHHLYSLKAGLKDGSVDPTTSTQIWRQARQTADEDGLEDNLVALVRFANDMKECVTCTLVINDDTLESAREAAPFSQVSALTGKKTEHPMDIASCME